MAVFVHEVLRYRRRGLGRRAFVGQLRLRGGGTGHGGAGHRAASRAPSSSPCSPSAWWAPCWSSRRCCSPWLGTQVVAIWLMAWIKLGGAACPTSIRRCFGGDAVAGWDEAHCAVDRSLRHPRPGRDHLPRPRHPPRRSTACCAGAWRPGTRSCAPTRTAPGSWRRCRARSPTSSRIPWPASRGWRPCSPRTPRRQAVGAAGGAAPRGRSHAGHLGGVPQLLAAARAAGHRDRGSARACSARWRRCTRARPASATFAWRCRPTSSPCAAIRARSSRRSSTWCRTPSRPARPAAWWRSTSRRGEPMRVRVLDRGPGIEAGLWRQGVRARA